MQSAKGNSSIKQKFCSWDFTESSCRITNTYITFTSGQGLPSVLCNCKSNNTFHDHLAASCEDHKRNILSVVCSPVPTWGECRCAAYLLEACMVSWWLSSQCVRFLLAERKKAFFIFLFPCTKEENLQSVPTKRIFLPSPPTWPTLIWEHLICVNQNSQITGFLKLILT